MVNKNKKRSLSPKLIAISALFFVLSGIVTACKQTSTVEQPDPVVDPVPTEVTPDVPEDENPPSDSENVEDLQVYWLDDDLKLASTIVGFEKSNDKQQPIEKALNDLLVGNGRENYSTAIPENTKLLGVKETEDGLEVNLSQEFNSGGGSASMIGRLGQVVYTATTLDNDGKVWIQVNGVPLEALGGEGLIVNQPMTRQIYEENFKVE